MKSKLLYNINKLIASFSKKHAIRYFSSYYKKLLPNCSSSAVFCGEVFISDYRNLVVGKNVKIGKGCKFYSQGGIYISDGSIIEPNSVLDSCSTNFQKQKVNFKNSANYFPVFVSNGNNSPADFKSQINFFVVSTGRSGSNAIANFLNKNKEIDCRHEVFFPLTRLSTEFAHCSKSKVEIEKELKFILGNCSSINSTKKIIGDSDQKYANLIDIIYKLDCKSKFIWLIRRADDFVSSAFGRRWFDDAEYEYPEPANSFDTKPDKYFPGPHRRPYAAFRLNGYNCNVFSKVQWQAMSCFERCCWYWSYTNDLIESQLQCISSDSFMMIKLEELEVTQHKMYEFLDVPIVNANFEVKNKAKHYVHTKTKWTNEQIALYNKWCSVGMKKWYNE